MKVTIWYNNLTGNKDIPRSFDLIPNILSPLLEVRLRIGHFLDNNEQIFTRKYDSHIVQFPIYIISALYVLLSDFADFLLFTSQAGSFLYSS